MVALLLMLPLASGGASVCSGWMSSAEARMTCCSDGQRCPMHPGEPRGSGSRRVITQSEADTCCAWSEQQQSSGTHEAIALPVSSEVLGRGVVVPAAVPRLVLTDDWRTASPDPSPPDDKPVVLSTFLI